MMAGSPWRCLQSLGGYAAALVLCVALLAWQLRLWEIDLSVPLVYGGDALNVLTLAKGIVENGWPLANPRLGAPGTFAFYDYPSPDTLHYLSMRLLASFFSDYATVAKGMGVYAEGPIADPKDLGPALRRAVAVVKRARRRCRQAATHNPVARCVLPVPGSPTNTRGSAFWM